MNITITRLWSYLEILSSWRIAVWIEDGHIWRVWLWFLFKWLGSLVWLVFRLQLITVKSILKSFHIFVSHLIGTQLWRRIEHCFVNCVLCYNNVRVFYYETIPLADIEFYQWMLHLASLDVITSCDHFLIFFHKYNYYINFN